MGPPFFLVLGPTAPLFFSPAHRRPGKLLRDGRPVRPRQQASLKNLENLARGQGRRPLQSVAFRVRRVQEGHPTASDRATWPSDTACPFRPLHFEYAVKPGSKRLHGESFAVDAPACPPARVGRGVGEEEPQGRRRLMWRTPKRGRGHPADSRWALAICHTIADLPMKAASVSRRPEGVTNYLPDPKSLVSLAPKVVTCRLDCHNIDVVAGRRSLARIGPGDSRTLLPRRATSSTTYAVEYTFLPMAQRVRLLAAHETVWRPHRLRARH